jgi:polysaccharide export outer membrane protein
MKKGFILFLSLFLVQFAFGQTPTTTATETAQTPAQVEQSERAYVLGPGDVISVKVLGEKDFDFDATVDLDGNLEVPFFDKTLSVKCKTERDVRGDIAKIYSRYLKRPQLSLRVTERRSRPPVTVSGEVRTPGQVELRRKARLLELIAFSGGLNNDYSSGIIQVFRTEKPMCSEDTNADIWKSDDNIVPSRIYTIKAVESGGTDANPIIYPGDVIVAERAKPVYLFGEVRQALNLSLKDGGLTIMQALAMAGGVNPNADVKDIKVYRKKAGSLEKDIISINYKDIKEGKIKDFSLEPYDEVEVGKVKKKWWQYGIEYAIGTAKVGVQTLGSSGINRILY